MSRTLFTALLLAALALPAFAADKDADGWVTILDEKSFKEWKVMPDKADNKVTEEDGAKKYTGGQWSFKDGVLKGEGGVSHIFSPKGEYENFHFKADIKINDGGNGGQYFRVALGNAWPKGYEAQVNSTHKDPKRTGSLYNFVNIAEQLVPVDTWWTQEIIANGNHIVIKVNDKVVVDFKDDKNSFSKGHVAFQQHHQGSVIEVKNVKIKELPAAK